MTILCCLTSRIHQHLLLTPFCVSVSPFICLPSLYLCLKQCVCSVRFIFFWCFPLPFKLPFPSDSVQYLLPLTNTKTNYGGRRRKEDENKRVRRRAVWRGSGVRREWGKGVHPKGSLGWIIHLTPRHLRAVSFSVSHPLKLQSFVSQTCPREY